MICGRSGRQPKEDLQKALTSGNDPQSPMEIRLKPWPLRTRMDVPNTLFQAPASLRPRPRLRFILRGLKQVLRLKIRSFTAEKPLGPHPLYSRIRRESLPHFASFRIHSWFPLFLSLPSKPKLYSSNLPIRRKSIGCFVSPSKARSARISPTTEANLNPCPENPAPITTLLCSGCRSMIKFSSGDIV